MLIRINWVQYPHRFYRGRIWIPSHLETLGTTSKNIFQWGKLSNASSGHFPHATKWQLQLQTCSPLFPSFDLSDFQDIGYLALINTAL